MQIPFSHQRLKEIFLSSRSRTPKNLTQRKIQNEVDKIEKSSWQVQKGTNFKDFFERSYKKKQENINKSLINRSINVLNSGKNQTNMSYETNMLSVMNSSRSVQTNQNQLQTLIQHYQSEYEDKLQELQREYNKKAQQLERELQFKIEAAKMKIIRQKAVSLRSQLQCQTEQSFQRATSKSPSAYSPLSTNRSQNTNRSLLAFNKFI